MAHRVLPAVINTFINTQERTVQLLNASQSCYSTSKSLTNTETVKYTVRQTYKVRYNRDKHTIDTDWQSEKKPFSAIVSPSSSKTAHVTSVQNVKRLKCDLKHDFSKTSYQTNRKTDRRTDRRKDLHRAWSIWQVCRRRYHIRLSQRLVRTVMMSNVEAPQTCPQHSTDA